MLDRDFDIHHADLGLISIVHVSVYLRTSSLCKAQYIGAAFHARTTHYLEILWEAWSVASCPLGLCRTCLNHGLARRAADCQ